MKVQEDLPIFYAKKSLGQNFLISEAIAQKIAEASLAEGDCGVIEIGPAYGALTKKLAPLFKKVVAVEIDKQLILQLERNLLQNNINNVKIIHGDILKQDLCKIILEEFANLNVVVAANLPYYISTPIIMNLLKPGLGIKAITVMLQKELAERFCAKPGTKNTGTISYPLWYYSKPKKLFNVPKGNFRPIPKVDSAVVKFDMLQQPAVKVVDENLFFALIRESFKKRRKTLLNSLCVYLGLNKNEFSSILNICGFDLQIRPEQLTLQNFATLANLLVEELHIDFKKFS